MDLTLLHLLAAYGLCFGLMQDKAKLLTGGLKLLPGGFGAFFERMLECSYCTGFHTGWLVYATSVGLVGISVAWVVDLFLFAVASAAACYLLDAVVLWLEEHPSDPYQGT